MEKAVLNGVAFDGAGNGAVGETRRLGRGGQGLPAQLEVEVNAGLQAENKGELDGGFDRFTLLVFLCGCGLYDENIVLILRAIREGHENCAARVDPGRGGIAGGKKRIGDDGVLCIEAGEVETVGQVAVVELGQKDALADRTSGCADDGRRLRAVLVPCQSRAEVERCERKVFVRLSGFARLFALVALIGVRICADAGLGIIRLGGLVSRNCIGFAILTGFGVGFFGVGLLDVASKVTLGVAIRTRAGGLCAVVAARAAGGLARLENSNFLGFGLQNGIVRLG